MGMQMVHGLLLWLYIDCELLTDMPPPILGHNVNRISSWSDSFITPGRRQSKTTLQSRNVDQKSLETVFSIAICRPTGDKWQLKTLFISIFDARSSIVDSVFDCRLPGVFMIK